MLSSCPSCLSFAKINLHSYPVYALPPAPYLASGIFDLSFQCLPYYFPPLSHHMLVDHIFLPTPQACPKGISDSCLTYSPHFICPYFHCFHFHVSLYLHGSCLVIKMLSLYSNGNKRPCLLRANINRQFVVTLQCKAFLSVRQFPASFLNLIEVFTF